MTSEEIIKKYYDLSRRWDRAFHVKMRTSNECTYLWDQLDARQKQRNELVLKLADQELKEIKEEYDSFLDTEWVKKNDD